MSEAKYCYREHSERFEGDFSSREEAALEYAVFHPEDVDNGICTVTTGRCVPPQIEKFVPLVADEILNNAGEETEFSDGWCFTREQRDELQSAVEQVVRAWADKHRVHPDWFDVEDEEETTVNCGFLVVDLTESQRRR